MGGLPPLFLPMLPGATGIPPCPDRYLFEVKWDGVRVVARVGDDDVRLSTRLGRDVTAGYPELAALPTVLGCPAVLDGEVVAFDEQNHPSFQRLQRRMHARPPSPQLQSLVPIVYVVFDVMWLDGHDVTALAQRERRDLLDALSIDAPIVTTSPLLATAPDEELLAACRHNGLEGYVAKHADAPYQPGARSKAWSKVKCVRRREFVVGGWSGWQSQGQAGIKSLAIGYVEGPADASAGDVRLRYVGQVGSGITSQLHDDLMLRLAALASDTSPFTTPDRQPRLHYVRPELVVQVAFEAVTEAGILLHQTVVGVRDDVDPSTVTWDDELAR